MKELEFVKQKVFDYVDLEVFVEGDIYYIVNTDNYQSVVAVCLTKNQDRVIFKVKYYIRGDFGISTINDDKFMFSSDTPHLDKMRVFPVDIGYFVDMMNSKIRVLSEIEMIY